MEIKLLKNKSGEYIKGTSLVIPKIICDSRGYFYESWNSHKFNELIGESIFFLQDNLSFSYKGVLRGMHYQTPPFEQGKLISCLEGEIYDVAIDIRVNSPTYGTWIGALLCADNHHQLWVPSGFAHGFLTLSKHAKVLYKVTNIWNKESERSICWDDPTV